MVPDTTQIQSIIQEIDRLIAEMATLRNQVIALTSTDTTQTKFLVKQAEYFGMWNEREDMADLSSREWLEKSRQQHWSRQ